MTVNKTPAGRASSPSEPKTEIRTPANILSGIGMIALIIAACWAAWRFGGLVVGAIVPNDPTDRLAACILIAAILHAAITTPRKAR